MRLMHTGCWILLGVGLHGYSFIGLRGHAAAGAFFDPSRGVTSRCGRAWRWRHLLVGVVIHQQQPWLLRRRRRPRPSWRW